MKRILNVLTLLALLAGFARAQVGLSGGVDFASKYLWRGYEVTDSPVAQPTLDMALGNSGFSVNFWGSFALSDRGQYGIADEFDVTLTYGRELAHHAYHLNLGVIYYTFPNQDNFSLGDHTTPEVFASLGFANLPFTPHVAFYYDLNLGDGWFAAVGGEKEFHVASQPFVFATHLGYNQNQFGAEAGFRELLFSLGSELAVGDFSVTPSINAELAPEHSMTEVHHWFVVLSVSR
ncbi:MAG TPA: hypothetical protein PKV71_00250 [Calditrichia bacterium]|nr:hypothetical protein [Calditrichota bacterium]HQU71514.1 hypothetical protein [Calditrichia bacterium]HQV30269.1 hypothetical protein [Calditrichia bacterium]